MEFSGFYFYKFSHVDLKKKSLPDFTLSLQVSSKLAIVKPFTSSSIYTCIMCIRIRELIDVSLK